MCGHLVVHRNNKVTLSLSRELIRGEPIIPILRRHTFIMNDYPSNVKQKLNSIIADMSEHHWLFSNNPGHNFMRQHQGKLSFYDTMRLIIDMGKGTTNDEIMDYFDMVPDLIPSQSAFNQRRSQISLSAFEYLFRKYIVTADRGYESYDLLFHCELKNLNYVFRVKAPSSKSLLSYYATELPDDLEEFDVTMKRYFTDKATNVMKDQSDVYRYINPSKNTPHFYELLNRDRRHLYFMQFRVVKIKTAENTYEYLITNLPHSFTMEDIKECYHWRWGIEISFRYLKHANGLLYFHSKKPEFLKQEIYANLTLYNFGIFIANEAAEESKKKERKNDNKYLYEIDISSALKTARKFFIRRDSDKPIDIIKLMLKYVHAVKEKFRQFDRPLRGISAIHFGYR